LRLAFAIFVRFSARKVRKHPTQHFTKFPWKQKRTWRNIALLPRFFFCFVVFVKCEVFPGEVGKKTPQKAFQQKNDVNSFNQKHRPPEKSSICFLMFLHVSRQGEFKNSKQKIPKNICDRGTFLASEQPTNHVKVRPFLFGALLEKHRL
jgi:hypothetical protein